VKLLLDENLSPRLAERLQDIFPASCHVETLGLGKSSDEQVWAAAKAGDFAIVTKDADFQDMATLRGAPPKVLWIRRGNCSTQDMEALLRRRAEEIEMCLMSPDCVGMMLY
jgi:predicted nuclease of predicted toxin-antitoxin system